MAFVLVGLMCCMSGCLKGDRCAAGASGELSGEPSIWTPTVQSIRIYPSTRYVREGDKVMLEARVEFVDQMGDTVKAGGDMRFDLWPLDVNSGQTGGELIYEWTVPLRTIAKQREHYDPITRTYTFRLKIDRPDLVRRPTNLHAVLIPATGQRLEANATVEYDW